MPQLKTQTKTTASITERVAVLVIMFVALITGYSFVANGMLSTLKLLKKIPGSPSSASGQTYYIKTDGNDNLSGTSWESAWASLENAVSRVPGGSTIIIRTGTYYPVNYININKPNLTIKKEEGSPNPIFDGTNTSLIGPEGKDDRHFFYFGSGNDHHGFLMDGLTIQNAGRGQSTRKVCNISGVGDLSHPEFSTDYEIRNTVLRGSSGGGIFIAKLNNFYFHDSEIYDNVYVWPEGASYGAHEIYFNQVDDLKLERLIIRNSGPKGQTGIHINGDEVNGVHYCNRVVIKDCIIHDINGYAIDFMNVKDSIIENNLIYNLIPQDWAWTGWTVRIVDDTSGDPVFNERNIIRNNTIILKQARTPIYADPTNTYDTVIMNNLLFAPDGFSLDPTAWNALIGFDPTKNNIAVNNIGYAYNAENLDNNFIDYLSNNYHLKENSQAKDGGIALVNHSVLGTVYAPKYDFEGDLRPQPYPDGQIDIGADEYRECDPEGPEYCANDFDDDCDGQTDEDCDPAILIPLCLADSNNDGKINISDLAILDTQYMKSCANIDPQFICMDLNNDNVVNVSDLSKFATYYPPNTIPFATPEDMINWCSLGGL